MRVVFTSLAVAIALATPLRSYTVEEMWAEFDASKLSVDEKRYLQFGLAVDGKYNALVDGAWGAGSQRALEAWARSAALQPPIENWEVVLLATQTADRMRTSGWEQRYFETMDMSFAVPAGQIQVDPSSSAFLNYTHIASSLRYSLALGDLPQAVGVHSYALSTATSGAQPYALRREKVLVTAVEQAGGILFYVRSDLRRNGWATVALSAATRDRNLLDAVSGSITKGWSNGLTLPPGGELSEGFASMASILSEAGQSQPNDYASLEGMRERMTAPPVTPPAQLPPVQQATLPPAVSAPPIATPREPTRTGSGTAFVVSEQGHLLTNAHVVAGCDALKIEGRTVAMLAKDENFDLALIKDAPQEGESVATFANSPADLNADITVAGYPLAGLLSGLNITRGSVSSVKGISGDSVSMQISAPVQPGNSGGPVVDVAGNVVGIVVSKLDAALVAEKIGDIPQNVNFAIRGEMARLFLFQNGVEPILGVEGAPLLDAVALGKELERMTRLVECYGHSD